MEPCAVHSKPAQTPMIAPEATTNEPTFGCMLKALHRVISIAI